MQPILQSNPMRMLVGVVLLMLVIALGAYARLTFEQAKYANFSPASITVTGVGEVNAIPDIGQFSFSVMAEGTDAAVAQEASGTKINEIIAYLKEQGVEEKDIKTQDYNLYPRYRYEERACAFGNYCPPGEQVADGFEVTQTVSVKVRTLDNSGQLIAGVGERGATNISGLSFTIDDPEALKAQAREAAIVDAKEKAALLSQQLGVRITRMMGYYENEGGYYDPYMYRSEMAMDMEESAMFGGPDLPVGEQTTNVNISITYQVE